MANVKYNKGKEAFIKGDLNFGTDTFKIMLVTSAYTPDNNHDFRSEVTNEVVGTGYTAGGQAIAGVTALENDTNDNAVLDCNNITWSNSTITARGCVLYKDTGNSATDILVAYYDFVTDKTSSAGDFTLTINASGLLTLA